MTRACCRGCGLRFTRASAAYLAICPECGAPLEETLTARDAIGYRLHVVGDSPPALPVAIEVALPEPGWAESSEPGWAEPR